MKIYNLLLLLILLMTVSFISNCAGRIEQHDDDEFDAISLTEIKSADLSRDKINASNNETNQIPDGTILVYETSEGRFGKLRITNYGPNLTLKWRNFNPDGSVESDGENLVIKGTWFCDLDLGEEGAPSTSDDFHWELVTDVERYFAPRNGARFAIFKEVSLKETNIKESYFEGWLEPILEGFDVRLSSGAGEGQILFDQTDLSVLNPDVKNIYFDVPDLVILFIHLYLNDLNLESYNLGWSIEKEGSLKLTITFEEDGKEILGTWHGDISDAKLTIYFIPYIDSYKSLHWKVDADLEFEEEIEGFPESWVWDKEETIAEIEDRIEYTLSNDVDDTIMRLLNFEDGMSNKNAKYYNISITEDSASFVYSQLDQPRQKKDITVKFDQINIHRQVEPQSILRFKGDVNGNSTHWSKFYSGISKTIYLNGTQWQREVSVVSDQPLNVRFEGEERDEDWITPRSLGEIDLTILDTSTELQEQESSSGDFTLKYWVLDAQTPSEYKLLSVNFDRIDVHDDEDSGGSGELYFEGQINDDPTFIVRSGQYDRDSGTKIYLRGGQWQKTVYVKKDEELKIYFKGYDDDTFTEEAMGDLRMIYSDEDNWGVGCHQESSSSEDFTLHFRVIDLDAEPLEDTKSFLITFTKIEVHDDEDSSGSGELFFYGSVNCDYTSLSTQMDLNSGDSTDLVGGNWFKRVKIPQTETIHIFFTGYDGDETTIESLGDVEVTHSADDNWGLDEEIHRVQSSNGDFTLSYKIEKLRGK